MAAHETAAFAGSISTLFTPKPGRPELESVQEMPRSVDRLTTAPLEARSTFSSVRPTATAVIVLPVLHDPLVVGRATQESPRLSERQTRQEPV